VTNYLHMTVLAVRYETGTRRRFERRDESRMMQMQELRERIERDDYSVDAEKVADAIVRRLMQVAAPRRS
jgi:anti-sigma28 factor (negative regulator of flagellin synthesis)